MFPVSVCNHACKIRVFRINHPVSEGLTGVFFWRELESASAWKRWSDILLATGILCEGGLGPVNKGAFPGAGRLTLEGGEKRSKAVVVVLTPRLIGMMMSLGALQANSKKDLPHVLHALFVPADIAIPCDRRIIPNRPGSSQDFVDELIVGLIGLNGLPDPLVEGVGVGAVPVIPALVSQDGCPFSGKEICVTASFQKLVDELRALSG